MLVTDEAQKYFILAKILLRETTLKQAAKVTSFYSDIWKIHGWEEGTKRELAQPTESKVPVGDNEWRNV